MDLNINDLKNKFNDTLTIKEAYDAMTIMLEYYYNLTNDKNAIVTVFGEGKIDENGDFYDSAFFEYYLDCVEKAKGKNPSLSSIFHSDYNLKVSNYSISKKQRKIRRRN